MRARNFAEVSLNGVSTSAHWDTVDVRYANDAAIFGKNLIYGVTVNNNPSVQDVWNSSPVWSFPCAQSLFAPAPRASTLLDGWLAQTTRFDGTQVGASAYGSTYFLAWFAVPLNN